jgi:ABC-type phosphate transport system substrate-binding protein
MVAITATASIMATSLVTVASPAVDPMVATAATTCVIEDGSTTVYPSLVNAQAAYQGAVLSPQPNWATGQKLGCDVSLTASGSGTGKTNLRNYLNGTAARRDVAASSAPLNSTEAQDLMGFQTGGDGMVIAVRSDNPVNDITQAELTAIYNGNISTWQELSNANGKTGTIVPRARIPGSGTRDDMNRIFRMDRGTTQSTAPYTKVSCSSGWTECEPDVIDATGLPRLVTSQEEADAVCNSSSAIVYTSLANLQLYGPGTAGCGGGFTLKALKLQACTYPTTYTGTTNPLSLTCSGSFIAPSVTTAAVGGTYPAKRQLILAMGKVSKLVAKYGTGNGTGWTDDLGTTKAFDLVNYMLSTQGQTSVGAVGFIPLAVPAKQPVPDADIDLSGSIGLTDIGQVTGAWNRSDTIPGSTRRDVDNSGGVGLSDIGRITGQWGATGFVQP